MEKQLKMINSNGICKHCQTRSINYGIQKGSFTYYCMKCERNLTKDEVLTENTVYTKDGRMFKKGKKELFYIARVEKENSIYDMLPCECDAMGYFILECLNNGNFDKFYHEYMKT